MVGYDDNAIIDEFNKDSLFSGDIIFTYHIDGNIESFLKRTGRYRYPIHIINKDAKELTRDDLEEYGGKLVVITSPPYNRAAEHDQAQIDAMPEEKKHGHRPAGYENPKNIAMMDAEEYQKNMHKVWEVMYNLNVAYIVTVTRDHIDGGRVYKLSSITDWCVTTSGYEKIEHIQAKIPYLSLFKRMNYKNHHEKKGLPLIDYEDVQIFRRKL